MSEFLGALHGDDLAHVVALGHVARSRPGEVLLRPSDDAVVVLLSGAAIASAIDDTGEEAILAVLGPGCTCGLSSTFGSPSPTTQIRVLTAAEALVLPGPTLRQEVMTSPSIAIACLRATASQLAGLRDDLTSMIGTSTAQRIAARLVELAERWGQVVDGAIRIRLPLTQDQLGMWANASRESTAKVLHDLRLAGVLSTGRRELTIHDLEELKDRRAHPTTHDDRMRELLAGCDRS